MRSPRERRSTAAAWFATLALAILAMLAPASAMAADGTIRLAVEPVGEDAQFFERSLEPGASAELVVNLANYGDAAVKARTFAADVYSIINGGFGARLRDEPTTGTTTWLDYPAGVLTIEPGQAIRRSFTVTVPGDARPGEYITSIVIENDEPIESGGGIAFNQFMRSAIAVVITVPGPSVTKLELGDARHSFLGAQSVVGVAIDNTGDLLLRPAGTIVITTEAGETVDQRAVAMDSVYAHTSTWLEIVLDRGLSPGRYLAVVDVSDPDRGGGTSGSRPFEVGSDAVVPVIPNPGTAATDTVELPVIGPVATGGMVVPAFVIGITIGATAIALLALARRRRLVGRDDRPRR
jgi:hypothetical protein